jgi:rhamnogalacturonyl hydrolase YesR
LLQLNNAVIKVRSFIEKEKFKGYDPYDTLNTFIPLDKMGKWVSAIAIQIQKRNPVNIRPLLGIKKGINPKSHGLLLYAYSLQYEMTKDEKAREIMEELFDWLINNYSKGYSGYCWGYNFGWANPIKYVEPYVPNIVATSFVGKGIFQYYLTTKNEKAKEVLISITNFLLKDLPKAETDRGLCISYTPVLKDACFNATLLGGEILSKAYSLNGDEELKKKAKSIVDFVISYQLTNGLWNYEVDIETGRELAQTDFHQGYNVESISEICKYAGFEEKKYTNSIIKGLEYYRKEQFYDNGQSLWRLPKIYPVEIHNQSQGIITFSLLKNYNGEYLSFANKIAEWTIENMQDKNDGRFYFRKTKNYDIKIPYMRWSQAWMFLALTRLQYENKNSES